MDGIWTMPILYDMMNKLVMTQEIILFIEKNKKGAS